MSTSRERDTNDGGRTFKVRFKSFRTDTGPNSPWEPSHYACFERLSLVATKHYGTMYYSFVLLQVHKRMFLYTT